ncbi:hypothetical protein SAMN05444000_1345 [Shimia gijangensis]|uniref:Uncharacterized protein n=1 Tax=Shimia gijangensis TaxID=1470563 RepID=A0A1M6T0Z7_9RHOB|nr:hypothetical protein SAMN05444000_1345 [Shimia gijangensis]
MSIAPSEPGFKNPGDTSPTLLIALVRLLAREAARADFATRGTEQQEEVAHA